MEIVKLSNVEDKREVRTSGYVRSSKKLNASIRFIPKSELDGRFQ